MYNIRNYRESLSCEGLIKFTVAIKETDLFIAAEKLLKRQAVESIKKNRSLIEEYIKIDPLFKSALEPYKVLDDAPLIVKEMAEAGGIAGVGPMASVAGAIAEYVGRDLLNYSQEIIVENGGDIFIKSKKKRRIKIFAGDSIFSERIGIEIEAEDTPLGICTSSKSVGPSLSFGNSDASVVISKSTILADALATKVGNMVKEEIDIEKIKKFIDNIKGVKGVLVIKGDRLGLFGDIKILKM